MKLNRATFKWICYPGKAPCLTALHWDNLSIKDIYELSPIKGDVPSLNASIHPFYNVKPITELTIIHC